MGGYASPHMRELRAQAFYAPREVRSRYARRIEELLPEIDPHLDYPQGYVSFRVTAFEGQAAAELPIPGAVLRADMVTLLDEISRDLREPADADDGRILAVSDVALRCRVCERTVRRWHRDGLPMRWFLSADGHLRLGLRECALEGFIRSRPRQMRQSARFSRLTEAEREQVIALSRKMRDQTGLGITEVSRRVAEMVGRAPETVRYTIRAHDRRHSEAALFKLLRPRLTPPERERIAMLHGAGVPVRELCRRYGKSRSVIYAAIQATAVARVLARRVRYVHNDEFEAAGAERAILGESGFDVCSVLPPPPPAERDDDAYHAAVSQIPVLSRAHERDLFRRYNYVKFRMAAAQKEIGRRGYIARTVGDFERTSRAAAILRRDLVSSNLRLVGSVARRHAGPLVSLQELVSAGSVALMRAVESFDYARGNKFSTYATWAITREFARTVPEENYRLATFITGKEDLLRATGRRDDERRRTEVLAHLKHLVARGIGALSGVEREVIRARFGLDLARPMTLREVGSQHHLTAERIRQIQNTALAKLRTLLGPEVAEGLSA